MTNVPLTGKGSSIFDMALHMEHHPHGSSLTSFAWKPNQDEAGRKVKRIAYENTYKMDPPQKFRADQVKPIIDRVLTKNLEGKKYNPVDCTQLCKTLSEDIKKQVKDLHFERYKILSIVSIGQKSDQGVSLGSRFLWDPERDNFATSSWSNREMYAVGTVYALYYE